VCKTTYSATKGGVKVDERKGEGCRATHLRALRRAQRLTADQTADILGLKDCKAVLAIETGRRSITMSRAGRAAYHFGLLIVDVEEAGPVIVQPWRGRAFEVDVSVTPGDAAWGVLRENKEALRFISEVARVMRSGTRAERIRAFRECILQPIRAAEDLGAAVDRMDPTIRVEACLEEAQEAAGLRRPRRQARTSQPLDAA